MLIDSVHFNQYQRISVMFSNNLANIILHADSYKASHWLQYPQDSEYVSSYVEARKGDYPVLFFGLQAFIKEYLTTPITQHDVDEAKEMITAHGLPFNYQGWSNIVSKHGGHLPIRIQAVAEGSIYPTGNVLCQVVNTDPEFYWLTSYLETALLRAIWYPTTVASVSKYCKNIIKDALEKSADSIESLPFKLHDFGARGASSMETVALGGLAHIVNFLGTDRDKEMPAFSIPAAEHSTMTSWGRDNESKAYANMLEQFGGVKEQVQSNGATLVIRPDSGDPAKVVRECLERLAVKFGYTINSKGYKILPNYIRLIQGDGINAHSISHILDTVLEAGFSSDNLAFGMGGGLLQQVNRDTLSFAMKASAISINGQWHDVFKDPITSTSKRSKKGRLALIKTDTGVQTIREDHLANQANLLRDVYVNGKLLINEDLSVIRKRTGW